MRKLLTFALALLLILPAGLYPAGAHLQTPGSRARYGVWTRDGFRSGAPGPAARRNACDRQSVFRSGSGYFGGVYTSRTGGAYYGGGQAVAGQTIGPAGSRCRSGVTYGYNGRYGADVRICSPAQHRATHGVSIGKR